MPKHRAIPITLSTSMGMAAILNLRQGGLRIILAQLAFGVDTPRDGTHGYLAL